ncbi:MAG: BatD family protein [Cloacibacterium sp.]|jgi:hypothetical protein|nr:BatD family protein [Cloacibacterium sp.]
MKQTSYILFCLISIFGYGQVTLATETDSKELKLNEKLSFTIILGIRGEDFQEESPLKLPDLSKFNIIGSASETYTNVDPLTKTRVKQLFYHLILEPKQAGKFKIGSALVQVSGRMYKSEPFEVVVKDGGTPKIEPRDRVLANDVFLNLEAEDKQVYENEPVVLVLRAFSRNYDNFRKVENIRIPKQNDSRIHAISYKKEDIEQSADMASQVIATFVYFPEKSGSTVVPSVAANIASPNNKIVSNRVNINVKSLPEKKPGGFKNAVGKFSVELINPGESDVEIDKPLDIWVKISGVGNLKNLQVPKILQSENYSFFKPKASSKVTLSENGFSGEITERYVLIPKTEGSIAVRLENFSYFNPAEDRYVNLGKKELIINSLNSEMFSDKKSTLEKVIDNTNSVLETVKLPALSSDRERKTDKKGINWAFVMGNFLLVVAAATLIFSLKNRRKNKEFLLQTTGQNSITTIAETEELLKKSQFLDYDAHFIFLKNLMEQEEYDHFFNSYEELHQEAGNHILEREGESLKHYLEAINGNQFGEEFELFRSTIQMEKYAPIHEKENIEKLYGDIVKFYSQITK